MPASLVVRLDALDIVERLSQAPLGALLQFRTPEAQSVTGMRAVFVEPGYGPRMGIVYLAGDEAGRFATDQELADPPALDVGSVIEIVLIEPAPVWTDGHILQAGSLCRVIIDSEWTLAVCVYTSRAMHQNLGFLVLAGPERGQIAAPSDVLNLGRVDVREIDASRT